MYEAMRFQDGAWRIVKYGTGAQYGMALWIGDKAFPTERAAQIAADRLNGY